MMRVPCHLDRSPIHGVGVFASQVIPKGTLVWRWDPRVDLEYHALEVSDGRLFDLLRRLAFRPDQGSPWMLCIDEARYMNHSETPCLDGDSTSDYANRDIAEGEELTCDYATFDYYFRTRGFQS